MATKYTVESKTVKIPEYVRTFFHDEVTDELYIAADTKDYFSSCFDRISVITDGGHTYLPLSWFQEEYPGVLGPNVESGMRQAMQEAKESG